MASGVLGSHVAGGPFGKPLSQYTIAELDFVLEMAALDEPERYSFVRNGVESGRSQLPKASAKWSDVLKGQALMKFMAGLGLDKAIRNRKAWGARQRGSGMRIGVTRMGKPIHARD